jgi:DNA-binding CsgD family transcriptional regulator
MMKIASESYEMFIDVLAASALRYEDRESAKARLRASIGPDELLKSHARPDPFKETAPLLSLVKVPTLIVVPDATFGMPFLENARAIASLIPNARIVFTKGDSYTSDGSLPELVSILDDFRQAVSQRVAKQDSYVALSAREIEVLALMAAGKTNRQISAELVISVNTVGRHVANIFAKTGTRTRAEAVSFAHYNFLLWPCPSLESPK